MKMRNIIPLVTGGTLLATLFGGSTLHAATKSKPNLVLVLVDDMGWGAFAPNHVDFTEKELNQEFCRIHVKDYTAEEAFEAAQKATPYLNRYCQEGVRFTNAYVTANVSAPSRAGLLTSSYQQRYGLYIIKEAETGIPTTVLTMPQVMKDYGYANGAFGKYHNGKGMDEIHTCSPGHHPLDRGFDYWFGFNSHGTSYYNSPILFRNRENIACAEYTTDKFTEEAVQFIRGNEGSPKLIYLAYNALHGPLGAPAPDKYMSRFQYKSKLLNTYAAYTAAIDDGVAAVMKELEKIGEIDNTMLVFISDNGAPGGAAAVLPKNGPFSGFKGQAYEGGIRVPMFIWYGDKIKQGYVCNEMASAMDIFPTFFDEAGISLPKQQAVDGKSLMPLLHGTSTKAVHEYLVWMSQQAENWGMYSLSDQQTAEAAFMVRKGDFMLRYIMEEDTYYLHNLKEDRKEGENLIAQYPELTQEMKTIFKDWFQQMIPPIGWRQQLWQNVQFWIPSLPKPLPVKRKTSHKKKTNIVKTL